MKRHLIIAAAAVTIACSPVIAEPQQGPGPGPGARLSEGPGHPGGPGRIGRAPGGPGFGPGGGLFGLLQFDANADGKLTKAEFDAGQKALFADIDGDKDGVSTPEEREAGMKIRREKMEKARFNAIDTDKNGQISKAELAAAQDQGGPGLFARVGRPPAKRPDRGGPDGRPDRGGPDGDGPRDAKLTFEEFAKRGQEAFTRADTDKNGTVTISELQALTPL